MVASYRFGASAAAPPAPRSFSGSATGGSRAGVACGITVERGSGTALTLAEPPQGRRHVVELGRAGDMVCGEDEYRHRQRVTIWAIADREGTTRMPAKRPQPGAAGRHRQ